MKTFITIALSILILTFFTQCSSAQFDKKAPFTISKAYYQDWVGGRPGSSGTILTLELTAPVSNHVIVDSLFYKGKICKLDVASFQNKHTISGNFIKTNVTDRDIIMHSDPRKEMTNNAPDVIVSFPFELTDNECVISYFIKKKKHYYKLTNLTKEKTIYYQ